MKEIYSRAVDLLRAISEILDERDANGCFSGPYQAHRLMGYWEEFKALPWWARTAARIRLLV